MESFDVLFCGPERMAVRAVTKWFRARRGLRPDPGAARLVLKNRSGVRISGGGVSRDGGVLVLLVQVSG